MKQQYRLIAGFLLTAMIGGMLGVIVQISAFEAGGWYGGNPVAALGLVSYGLFFWITVCTARAYYSRCGLHASLLVLSLLIPVLCGYCAAAHFFYYPLNEYVIRFGFLMLLPAAAAAWILRATRRFAAGRIAVRCIGTLALFFDLAERIRWNPLAILTAAALYIWFLYLTRDLKAEKTVPADSERQHRPRARITASTSVKNSLSV